MFFYNVINLLYIKVNTAVIDESAYIINWICKRFLALGRYHIFKHSDSLSNNNNNNNLP